MPATPQDRVAELLEEALKHVKPGHAAYESLSEASRVVQNLDPYLERCSTGIVVPSTHPVPKEQVLKEFARLFKDADEHDWKAAHESGKTGYALAPMMCAGPFEGSLMQHIALLAGSKKIIEIGVFVGTTTAALALIPEVEKIVALEIEDYLEEFDRPYWKAIGVSEKIDMRIGDAHEALKKLRDEGFVADLAFIDADKLSYTAYYKALFDYGLISPGGIIVADNTLYKSYPYADSDKKSIAAGTLTRNGSYQEATNAIISFNDTVRKDPTVDAIMIPVRDGVTIIRKKR